MTRPNCWKVIGAAAGAFALGVLLGPWTLTSGQGVASDPSRYIRVEWAVESSKRGLWALCGSVYNDHHIPARHVELLVESREAAGGTPERRTVHWVNDVPAGRRAIFCLPLPAGTTTDRVTVEAVEWGFHGGP